MDGALHADGIVSRETAAASLVKLESAPAKFSCSASWRRRIGGFQMLRHLDWLKSLRQCPIWGTRTSVNIGLFDLCLLKLIPHREGVQRVPPSRIPGLLALVVARALLVSAEDADGKCKRPLG